MLRDTNRLPSADLELTAQQDNPASDASVCDADVFDRSPASTRTSTMTTAMTQDFIANSARWLDARNSKPDGSSTLMFKATIILTLLQSPLLCAGKHYLPSLLQGLQYNDPILVVGTLVWSAAFIAIAGSTRGLRHLCRPDGIFKLLGLGETVLSDAERKALDLHYKLWHPKYPLGIGNMLVGLLTIIDLAGLMGIGLQDTSIHNRLAALGEMLFVFSWMLSGQFAYMYALKLAATLACAKAREIEDAIRAELRTEGDDVGEEQWHRTVIAPCRTFVPMLRDLSSALAPGIWWLILLGLMMSVGSLAFIMAPSLSRLMNDHDHDLVAAHGALILRAMLLNLTIQGIILVFTALLIPAKVTNACLRVQQALNDVRLNDLSSHTNSKLRVLELALLSDNHGQGIGFTFAGQVIGTDTLWLVAAKLAGLVSFILPFVLPALIRQIVDNTDAVECGLTSDQRALLQESVQSDLAMMNVSTTCGFNLTFF